MRSDAVHSRVRGLASAEHVERLTFLPCFSVSRSGAPQPLSPDLEAFDPRAAHSLTVQ